MAAQLDPQLMDILACPAEDHGPLRLGVGCGRPHLHRLRPPLPGGGRHPGAADRPRDQRRNMTGLDDTLLGDARALAALDTGGVLRSAATAGAQVRSTAHAAQEARVGDLAGHRPRALVLLRRAGAATPAFVMLAALLGPDVPGAGRVVGGRAELDRPAGRRRGAHRRRVRRRPGGLRRPGGGPGCGSRVVRAGRGARRVRGRGPGAPGGAAHPGAAGAGPAARPRRRAHRDLGVGAAARAVVRGPRRARRHPRRRGRARRSRPTRRS